MNPLLCKIHPERFYFYGLVIVGHLLPDQALAQKIRDWTGIDVEALAPNGPVCGLWKTEERSISKIITTIANSTNFVMVKLPKSGMEIRKQIKRPDLLQSFGPDDRGLYTTQVGSHIMEFLVGWQTAAAAEEALVELNKPLDK